MTENTNPLTTAPTTNDPTRSTRISRAAALLGKITGTPTLAGMLAEAGRILNECELSIRTHMHDTRIRTDENEGAAISIDVSFALAAPCDGPQAALEYTRMQLTGRMKPNQQMSIREQVQLLAMARRNWLSGLAAHA